MEKAREMMNLVQLEGVENRLPKELSGGQQQRVSLARAMIVEPKVMLFDEPLSNLDAKLREKTRVEIRNLLKKMNVTAIYVTHDQEEALTISDRIAVMNKGRIEQITEPSSLYTRPATRFIAGFVGHANIVEGSVTVSYTHLDVYKRQVEVQFISFDDVRNGIDPDIKVIINAGDAYTAWSGAENWTDEKVVTAIRRFVDQGGGFIGVGEPTACQYEGRYFQLSDVLGADREMGFSMSTDKYNELSPKYRDHFILEDIKGEIDFGEGKNRIYAQGANYEILDMDGEYSRLIVNSYGKGRSVYFTGLPYSPQNCRILLRAIYYAAHREEEMKKYYVTNVDCLLYTSRCV